MVLTLFSTWNKIWVYTRIKGSKDAYVNSWDVHSFINCQHLPLKSNNTMYLFPSITSTKSSAVAFGSRMATSALLILYSLKIALISSWSILVSGTVFEIATPPLSFLRTVMLGGLLLSRMPNPSSSVSITFLSPRGLRTSRTMKMRWHVLATG